MKVYTLMWHVDNEGSGLIGVYSTLSTAKRFLKRYEELIKTHSCPGEWAQVYESELDESELLLPNNYGWYDPKVEAIA